MCDIKIYLEEQKDRQEEAKIWLRYERKKKKFRNLKILFFYLNQILKRRLK